MNRIAILGGTLLLCACSRLPLHRAAAPPPVPAPVEPGRPIPYPIFETHGFARAVARGTRTRRGEPGPNYWQQYAHYTIDAELVPATSRVNGRESVRYYNRSPDTLRTLWVELDQNLFAPSSPRVVSTPVTGGTEILRVAAGGQALASRDTGTGYSVYATNMEIRLPHALVPHDSIDLDVAWAFQLPPDGAPREGTTGDVFMVAYWYPRLAVYDDVVGWQNDAYLGAAEFYMGYADYDVNLTVPQGWLIASTGELTNGNDVLSKQTRDRLAEAR